MAIILILFFFFLQMMISALDLIRTKKFVGIDKVRQKLISESLWERNEQNLFCVCGSNIAETIFKKSTFKVIDL